MTLGSVQQTGALGQEIAKEFLRTKNYEILAEHFAVRRSRMQNVTGEIDLIALHDGALVAIEVKTRTRGQSGQHFGQREELIKPKQLRRIVKTLTLFRVKRAKTMPRVYAASPAALRIDYVFVTLGIDGRLRNIELLQNIDYEL